MGMMICWLPCEIKFQQLTCLFEGHNMKSVWQYPTHVESMMHGWVCARARVEVRRAGREWGESPPSRNQLVLNRNSKTVCLAFVPRQGEVVLHHRVHPRVNNVVGQPLGGLAVLCGANCRLWYYEASIGMIDSNWVRYICQFLFHENYMIYLDLWTNDEIDSIAYQWSYWGNHVCLDMDKPTDAYFPSRLHFRQLLLLLPIYKTGYYLYPKLENPEKLELNDPTSWSPVFSTCGLSCSLW